MQLAVVKSSLKKGPFKTLAFKAWALNKEALQLWITAFFLIKTTTRRRLSRCKF